MRIFKNEDVISKCDEDFIKQYFQFTFYVQTMEYCVRRMCFVLADKNKKRYDKNTLEEASLGSLLYYLRKYDINNVIYNEDEFGINATAKNVRNYWSHQAFIDLKTNSVPYERLKLRLSRDLAIIKPVSEHIEMLWMNFKSLYENAQK